MSAATRILTIALMLSLTAMSRAQDMPLSQILPEGQGWTKQNSLLAEKANPKVGDFQTRFTATSPDGKSTYVTVVGEKAIYLLRGTDAPKRFEVPLAEPTGLVFWNGGGTLVVADAAGQHLWAFRIDKDGALVDGDRYYPLRSRPTTARSEAMGMTVDPLNRLYVATEEGVKVFDPTGRMCGTLLKPAPEPLKTVRLEGTMLWVNCGGTWYARPLKPDGLIPPKPKQ